MFDSASWLVNMSMINYLLLDDSCSKFYCVFNCIFSRSKGANSELTTVELLKSYCLPFLLYGFDAVTV